MCSHANSWALSTCLEKWFGWRFVFTLMTWKFVSTLNMSFETCFGWRFVFTLITCQLVFWEVFWMRFCNHTLHMQIRSSWPFFVLLHLLYFLVLIIIFFITIIFIIIIGIIFLFCGFVSRFRVQRQTIDLRVLNLYKFNRPQLNENFLDLRGS